MDSTTTLHSSAAPTPASTTPPAPARRAYRAAGPLPAPPAGLAVMTKEEAASFFDIALKTWTDWEKDGRITIPRYRAAAGIGRPIYYAADDLERLRAAFRAAEQPSPDPERPGCYRVPIRSRLHSLFAIIDAEDLPKVQGRNWNWCPPREGSDRNRGGRPGEVAEATVGKRETLKRIILGLEGADRKTNIVYANGDPLDLRKANLVVRTASEKGLAAARPTARAGKAVSSRYRGVTWDSPRRLWKAQFAGLGPNRVLGRYRDEVEAALAYDAAAREQLGPRACLNFPEGTPIPARTWLGADGAPVREKNKYTVPPELPAPPEGTPVITREEAAELLGVSDGTFGVWERDGRIDIPRYRLKPVTGTPILYIRADMERLRDTFAAEGQPTPAPELGEGTWRVPIWTKKGWIAALIDEQDLPIVRGRCWAFVRPTEERGGREGVRVEKSATVILTGPRDTVHTPLKRMIMDLHDEADRYTVAVIHLNGDALDCRRANLAFKTASQKVRGGYKITHRSGEPTSSYYKGVHWNERSGCWVAAIVLGPRNKRIGRYDDEVEAAHAYDEAAREHFGADARVNFPRPGELPTALDPNHPRAPLASGIPHPNPLPTTRRRAA